MQSFYKGPRLFVTALTPRKSPQPRERNSCLFQGTPCLGRNTQKTAKGHGRGSRHRTSGGIRDGEMQQVDLNYSGSNQVRHKHWLLPPSHAPLKWQQRDFFFLMVLWLMKCVQRFLPLPSRVHFPSHTDSEPVHGMCQHWHCVSSCPKSSDAGELQFWASRGEGTH